jgi:hypothetical protein
MARPEQRPEVWPIGTKLEARDVRELWCSAEVIGQRGQGIGAEVQIHYAGWNKRWDEWLLTRSNRLRPLSEGPAATTVEAKGPTTAKTLPQPCAKKSENDSVASRSREPETEPVFALPHAQPAEAAGAAPCQDEPRELPPMEVCKLMPGGELLPVLRECFSDGATVRMDMERMDDGDYERCGTFGCILANNHAGLHLFPEPPGGRGPHGRQPRRTVTLAETGLA